jgi:hypothetical protein
MLNFYKYVYPTSTTRATHPAHILLLWRDNPNNNEWKSRILWLFAVQLLHRGGVTFYVLNQILPSALCSQTSSVGAVPLGRQIALQANTSQQIAWRETWNFSWWWVKPQKERKKKEGKKEKEKKGRKKEKSKERKKDRPDSCTSFQSGITQFHIFSFTLIVNLLLMPSC